MNHVKDLQAKDQIQDHRIERPDAVLPGLLEGPE